MVWLLVQAFLQQALYPLKLLVEQAVERRLQTPFSQLDTWQHRLILLPEIRWGLGPAAPAAGGT